MLQRILKLARDNERVVIVDPETERAFIVLPLDAYERLVDECAFDEEEFDTIDDDWVAPIGEEQLWEAGEAAPQAPLTEQSLIDSIDRDIAAWKATQERISEPTPEPVETPMAPPAASLDELTLSPMPGDEAPMKPPASVEEEKFYIEPVA